MITLYTTHCPKCKVLEKKLAIKGIEVVQFDDVDKMIELGIKNAPMLQIDDGPLMDFSAANEWVNSQEG